MYAVTLAVDGVAGDRVVVARAGHAPGERVSAGGHPGEANLAGLAELALVLLRADAGLNRSDAGGRRVPAEGELGQQAVGLEREVAEEVEAAEGGLDPDGGEVGEQAVEVGLGQGWSPACVLG